MKKSILSLLIILTLTTLSQSANIRKSQHQVEVQHQAKVDVDCGPKLPEIVPPEKDFTCHLQLFELDNYKGASRVISDEQLYSKYMPAINSVRFKKGKN